MEQQPTVDQATASAQLPMQAKRAEVLVEVMEGVTFSALLILFGFLYAMVLPVFFS